MKVEAGRMSHLKGLLERTFQAQLSPGETVVVFDVPCHPNVGDLLIFQGTQRLLDACQVKVRLSAVTQGTRHAMQRVEEGDTILLCGGGNMGDLWVHHEATRQSLLKRFPRNKTIVFPQSVHYTSPDAEARLLEAYSRHENLTVHVRDRHSHELLSRHLRIPPVLSPDAAHYVWQEPGFRSEGPGDGELALIRTDHEKAGEYSTSGSVDWRSLQRIDTSVAQRVVSAVNRAPAFGGSLNWIWMEHMPRMLSRIFRYMDSYSSIRTDRLHGMIIAALLEKEIQLQSDNSYGKLGRYSDAWFGDSVEPA